MEKQIGRPKKRPAHEVIVDKLLTQVKCHPLLEAEGEETSMVRGKIDVLLEILGEMVVPKGAVTELARTLHSFADRGDLRSDIVHNLRMTADLLSER